MTLAPPAVAPAEAPVAPRRTVWTSLLLPWLLLAILGSLWALATPIGGSPDEPAHVVKAASVVRGELLPETMVERGGVLHVPAAIAFENQVPSCFAFYADIPASCSPAFEGDPGALVETFSSASLYNPVYYALVGWPSLILPDFTGIYAMRIMSAVLTSFFLATCFWMIGSWGARRLPTLGVMIGITPIVTYLMGTVNPNALEFTAGLALFAGMLSIVLHPNEQLLGGRLALVVISAALVSNSRGISPLWVAVLLVLPLVLLTGRQLGALLKRPGVWVSILLIAITALISGWWTLSSNSLGTAPSAGPDVAPPNSGVGLSPIEGFFGLIGDFYGQLRQMVGILGWLDTTLHPVVYYVAYAMFALLVVGVVIFVRGRKLVFVILLAAAFFFLPPLVQAFYVTKGGFIWQGRYTLILLMALLLGMAACIAASDRFLRWRRSTVPLLIVAILAAAGWVYVVAYAFATTMRRMASGYKTDWPAMLEPGAWVPPLGSVALIALFTAASVGFGVYVIVGGRDRRPARPTPEPLPAGAAYPPLRSPEQKAYPW
ncbi:DUF2142 domain-containing protein [Herbiconiux ginsengi]|uniref:Predicted membrane protein n=1 Tax=Herbiconiux ginsengi TaxID=381665 RepID=A0A1H3STQ2_9MICO|nr:DUF2142 domain-containing protein [Herbiconiux ginsengi]SDZ41483.1 Predicted membrane protein [Herbiconiux ginsengi]